MKAAVFKGNGVLKVEDVEKPVITEPDEVVLKIIAASICGSDLHVLSVPPGQHADPGVIMGHEMFGTIEEMGAKVKKWKIGDRVVIDPIIKCGVCPSCKAGHGNLCEDWISVGQTQNGGFAQYVKIKSSQLYSVPEGVPSYLAAQAEPLSCVMNGINKISPAPADNVVVYGMGPIGLTFVRVLKLYGVKNIAVCETSESRREMAKKAGAELVIDSINENVKDVLLKEWGELATIVIDAVGAAPIMGQAIDILQPGATLLLFGQNSNAVAQFHPADIVTKELQVKGTFCTFHTFPKAIKLLQDPKLELERIISNRIELDDINEGIDLLRAQKASRVIVYPNGIVD